LRSIMLVVLLSPALTLGNPVSSGLASTASNVSPRYFEAKSVENNSAKNEASTSEQNQVGLDCSTAPWAAIERNIPTAMLEERIERCRINQARIKAQSKPPTEPNASTGEERVRACRQSFAFSQGAIGEKDLVRCASLHANGRIKVHPSRNNDVTALNDQDAEDKCKSLLLPADVIKPGQAKGCREFLLKRAASNIEPSKPLDRPKFVSQ
jgi:hypothetical protein